MKRIRHVFRLATARSTGAAARGVSYEAAVNGDYPAVIHEPEEGCTSCDVSSDFYARLDAENGFPRVPARGMPVG